jgi:hypothetical protein
MQHGKSTPHPDAATGDLTEWGGTEWGGITAGRVTAWAEALGTSADAIVEAARAVPPLMDTGIGKSRESHKRPTDPELRCIAWRRADVERIQALFNLTVQLNWSTELLNLENRADAPAASSDWSPTG